MNEKQIRMMQEIVEKLGFDPRKPKTEKKSKVRAWACDDSKQNPFSKLNQQEKDLLEEFVYGPMAEKMRIRTAG